MHERLQRIWYGGAAVPWWLRVLSVLFGALAAARRRAYRSGWLRSKRMPLPVIVVGNISVGGAGKTPLVLALLEGLRARGWRPGVISRGHGGSVRGADRLPAQNPDPGRYGDEPCLIAVRSGVPVAVAARRVDAARLLVDSGEVDLLIADDGLQHYALARDMEICVIDGRRGLGNGRLLPAGPLREGRARLREVDHVVINGGAPTGDRSVPMQLQPAPALLPMHDAPTLELSQLQGQRVHAVAGIGDPQRFFDTLRAAGIDPLSHPFPDHHPYRAADLGFQESLPVLMTEKDMIKCASLPAPSGTPGWYALAVTARVPERFLDDIDAQLRRIAHARDS